ncbi:MAG TPA: methyltransferase domain-containing protein [Candidatus Limnocylindrales bacterium]|nr:methyltransferase domain-containing protein [Candidatus Limnocylindrales bacterium]
MAVEAQNVDLGQIKARQQQTWASGNYAAVGARIQPMAELLVDAADVPAGSRVLDVATGSGNAAIAAARSDCVATGLDYTPGLLEHARARAVAEGFEIDFLEGDAENLPFADASFDAVTSVVGVMFATDQAAAASEMLRVCRPGGTVALANWTPDGFVGQMLKTIGRHVPPPPVPSPLLWGTQQRLGELLGDGVSDLLVRPRSFVFRFRSADEFAGFFRTNYGPVHMAFARLDEAGQAALEADLVDLAASHNRATGSSPSVAIPGEYLEVIATRR